MGTDGQTQSRGERGVWEKKGRNQRTQKAEVDRKTDRQRGISGGRKWEKEMCHGRAKREGNSLLERERRNIPLAESFDLAQFSDEDISL
jgi:hypothetical protein